MFTYTGLGPSQVQRLRIDHGIYMVSSGRACIAGLNPGNLQHVVQAMAAVMRDTDAVVASPAGASGRSARFQDATALS
jgi:aromatic-amino-acid transaminase